MKYYYILILLMVSLGCRKVYEVQVPSLTWDQFNASNTLPLDSATRARAEGVYTFLPANDDFGTQAAARWSYTANGTDTVFHLSFFCEKNISYFICEGRRADSTILLNGYWRKMTSTETGKVHLTVNANAGGKYLMSGLISSTPVTFTGVYGRGEDLPAIPLTLQYARPLYKAKKMEIVVHRGGGQTADLLPASENSAEIVPYAAQFGATGIEVDVRLTKDGIPIIYHDIDLSERLIQKNGLIGPIENYTYAQLSTLVRLIRNGERIPTLREVLQTMVYKTPLNYIWLDIKFDANMQQIRDLQVEFMQKAAALHKNVEITIGIPDTKVLNNVKALPNYQNVPTVCELDPPYVEEINARIWGPRWTLGLQNDKVAQVHAEGRRAFVWTLDLPENINQYLTEGNFDGILTNYPSALAYYYYVKI